MVFCACGICENSAVSHFTLVEAATPPAVAALSYPFGVQVAPRLVRRASGYTASIIGAFAGFCFAYQRSAGRLLGFLPPVTPQQAQRAE